MPEDKLWRQQALGSSGLFRRVQDAGPVETGSDRLDRARAALSEASERAGVEYLPPGDLPMPKAEFQVPALSSGGLQVKGAASPVAKGRGRPKVEGERPWEAAGVSRRTWYRRKAEREAPA